MMRNNRLLILLVGLLLFGGVGTLAVLHAADRTGREAQQQAGGPSIRPGTVTLKQDSPQLLFRSMAFGPHKDEITSVPADRPNGPRTASGMKCMRFHAAGHTGICLQGKRGALGNTYQATILDASLHKVRHFSAAGIPTRSRVSPSGRMAAWTVFVSGDSYARTNFSTRTAIVNTRTWTLHDDLEEFTVVKDGKTYRAADINVWGVTFADDNHFYATVATDGQTYLVRGNLVTRVLTTIHENVECPSLSPDGTRIAYKKRVAGADPDDSWRLYVLDLATMTEIRTAEQHNIDDQVLWADDHTLVYALAGDYGADLWTVPADGTGTASVLARSALAPAYLN
ncbi:TolB family protein [Streptomyces sp. NPDC002285]